MIDVKIPPEFWQMSRDEFASICDRGGLDEIQCRRLWRMIGRTDSCPKFIKIWVKPEPIH